MEAARKEYAELRARGLSLDLTRGKPSPEQLDLAGDLLSLPGGGDVKAADGTDTRNYGGLLGLPELREIFAGPLQVPAGQLLALGNASLTLMHDNVVQALLSVVPGGERRWADEPRVRFVCPVPGYDRHFGVCERYGIDMVPVPLTGEGPDMDVVEELVASDPTIKGMWCVPKYSNPTGEVYSDETVRRLAAMRTAAPDFRLFWDNAYAVHHLTGERVEILSILDACAEAGNPDRAFVFGSTSKITTAGSGVAFVGSSPANVAWMKERLLKQTIGPDKVNQLRHVRFFRDTDGVTAHMERHRALLEPRFAAVYEVLESELGPLGIAEWTRPKGGYFVSLDVPDGCASEVVRLAKEAGIALTPAGAAFPYGKDPRDREIRLAPSFPSVEEVREAMRAVAVCVRLAAAEQEAAGTAG
ncbi:aminotransferase [Streptomyces xinghaiensis]|uniref:Aminotransferase class I/II-fold pyridoxal phosphate-dependent enzyme n=1 Tax=Streptomyces xinghaiensis TaxID=1038928 RepID=A0A3R7LMK9_9ACTN|nr:aminotransferase [Streptomyces xinghaiensis]RKM93348.1 aminotransferase class I/II-fold pyridoxal phosphate-dependent enzyme [Streptomyces xinghaiensis]RNC71302.1 aminotransferase class I/II-fold pyridoxal phosphate-dependent enzyme [Streptomyces xinghaiensis]